MLGNAARILLAGAGSVGLAGGCTWDKLETWDRWHLVTPPPPPPPPVDSLVLRTGGLEAKEQPAEGTVEAKLAGAKELYRLGEFAKAERVFHDIADNTHNAAAIGEEARYYEADCHRLQNDLPKAADLYTKMLNDFPSGAFREQANQHLFAIADKWLDDTRKEMEETREVREGKRWFTTPHYVHIDKESPFLDKEGRALEALDTVRINDILSTKTDGRLADKALFLAGNVKFFNEDYREADDYFTQIVENYPDSPFATRAVELGIICKHMGTGGAKYDGRKVAEARILVDKALRNYPELGSGKKREFMERQLVGITLQQAEKDYEIGEFYRKKGKAPSAYFYYEIVRRRYPGTRFADLATERMHEIHDEVEKEHTESDAPKIPSVPPAAKPGQPLEPLDHPPELHPSPGTSAPTPPVPVGH
jgi:outer membrane protein assembly factor BamD (BamD/ComL family)